MSSRSEPPTMPETIQLNIEGMTCRMRAERIRGTLNKEMGVIDARVSFKRHTAMVKFDPERTAVDEILNSTAFTKPYKVKGSQDQRIIHRYRAKPEGQERGFRSLA